MNLVERILISICKFYPLKSGCGTIANCRLFRSIEQRGQGDDWVNVVGGPVYVPTKDYVGRSMKYFGDLDPKVSDIVDKVVRAGDTCIDVGANLGLVSLRMAEKVGPNGHVHAFEPQPQMIDYLKNTLSRRVISNITLHEIALGSATGTLTLSVPPGNAGRASLMPSEWPDDDTFDVEVRTLTECMKNLGWGPVSLVKIDVEGFESEVITGGIEYIRSSPPWVFIVEEHALIIGKKLPLVLELLAVSGYEIFSLPKTLFLTKLVPVEIGAEAHDYVAVHKTAPQHIREALNV